MGNFEIFRIKFNAGEGCDFLAFCGEGGGANTEKGIEQAGFRAFSMDAYALLDECDGKGRGVRALAFARLNRFVWDEPCVSPATEILSAGVAPAGDVRFMDVGDSGGAAIEFHAASLREVEDILVAVVDVALGVDGFKMSGGDLLVVGGLDGDGFHPMKGILENKQRVGSLGEREDDLVGEKRTGWGGSDVEEKRGVICHDSFYLGGPCLAPAQELIARGGILEGGVCDAEIVGRGGDDKVERFL